jgi:hypothetical protein
VPIHPDVVFFDQGMAAAAVEPAIEQVFNAFRIEIQRCDFLPETIAAGSIGPDELGFHQLLAEQQDQRLLFAGDARARR